MAHGATGSAAQRRRARWQDNPVVYRLLGFGTIGVLLVLWWYFTMYNPVIRPLYFPSPARVWSNLVDLRSSILEHAWVSFSRVLVGFVLGCAAGVAVGLLMSWSRVVFAILDPIIEAIRPIPPIALGPFFILWFGVGDLGKIILDAMGCFMVMAVSAVVAVRNVPPVYIRAARSLGASQWQIYCTIIIPGIVPALVSGFRVSSALIFGLNVAAEFLGSQAGLGFLIQFARRVLNTHTILLATIILGIQAFVFDRLIRWVSNYFTRWTEKLEGS